MTLLYMYENCVTSVFRFTDKTHFTLFVCFLFAVPIKSAISTLNEIVLL